MEVLRVIFRLVANKMSLHWSVEDIDCLKHPELNSLMVASTFSTSPSSVQIHPEVQRALEMETTENSILLRKLNGFFLSIYELTVVAHLISLLIGFVINLSFFTVGVCRWRKRFSSSML